MFYRSSEDSLSKMVLSAYRSVKSLSRHVSSSFLMHATPLDFASKCFSESFRYMAKWRGQRFLPCLTPILQQKWSETLLSVFTQMAIYKLLHSFHKQATNVSQHVVVILLWGISMSPLSTWRSTCECKIWYFI